MSWQEQLDAILYSPQKGWVDGTTEFFAMCARVMPKAGGAILEVGAGPSNETSRFLATLGEVHGVDPDPDVKTNASLASAHVITDDRYPFEDATFDLCVSSYVVEHVADPVAHLREIARVLRPGGAYVFRTPNRYHYVAAFASVTPHWVHVALANRLRAMPKDAHDPYPTVYAMNTESAVRRHAERAGFDVETLRMVEKEPSYGRASPILFLTFAAYERLVNSTEALAALRSNIFCVLQKRP